jgi:ornithine carbamoyltransferase
MKKDFLSLLDLDSDELLELLSLTDSLRMSKHFRPLEGKTACLLFQKPSLRTQVSFQVGVAQLGGTSIFLSNDTVGVGKREKMSDIAQVLSGYADVVIARLFEHSLIEELAQNATIPVINALTDLSHPCQILADVYTMQQHKKLFPGVKVAFIGDGNNVANSWIEMAALTPMHFVLAHPKGFGPDKNIVREAESRGLSTIEFVEDPFEAANKADVLYTDVWMSMGQEDEAANRKKVFAKYQINDELISVAKKDAIVMHCLPAHRGEEITESALTGKHSVVFEQAENRLHAQKAVLAKLVGGTRLASAALPLFEPVEWSAGMNA